MLKRHSRSTFWSRFLMYPSDTPMFLIAVVLILAIGVPHVGSPPVRPQELWVVPDTRTTFTCLPEETDEIYRTAFTLNGMMFHINGGTPPGVQIEHQYRTTNPRPIVNTTVTLDSSVCGSQLCCCYFNGANFNCRDCYLLECYSDTSTTVESTSTPISTTSTPATLEHHNSTAEFTTALPKGVDVLGLVLGIGAPVFLVIFCVVMGISYLVVARYTNLASQMKELWTKKTTSVATEAPKSTATNRPALNVETRAQIETDTQGSAQTVVYRNRHQGSAVYRDVLEFSTAEGGDGGLSHVIRVHANGSEPTSEESDRNTHVTDENSLIYPLILDPRDSSLRCVRESRDVHGISLPQEKAPANLENENQGTESHTTEIQGIEEKLAQVDSTSIN